MFIFTTSSIKVGYLNFPHKLCTEYKNSLCVYFWTRPDDGFIWIRRNMSSNLYIYDINCAGIKIFLLSYTVITCRKSSTGATKWDVLSTLNLPSLASSLFDRKHSPSWYVINKNGEERKFKYSQSKGDNLVLCLRLSRISSKQPALAIPPTNLGDLCWGDVLNRQRTGGTMVVSFYDMRQQTRRV